MQKKSTLYGNRAFHGNDRLTSYRRTVTVASCSRGNDGVGHAGAALRTAAARPWEGGTAAEREIPEGSLRAAGQGSGDSVPSMKGGATL